MALLHRVAAVLVALCVPSAALAAEPPPAAPAAPPAVRAVVDRAIGYLQTESAAWLSQRKCAACHHAPMPLWALGEADRRGYTVDRKFVADTIEGALGSPERMIASKLASGPNDAPDPRPMARGVNMGQVFMAFAARTFPAPTPGQIQSVRRIA